MKIKKGYTFFSSDLQNCYFTFFYQKSLQGCHKWMTRSAPRPNSRVSANNIADIVTAEASLAFRSPFLTFFLAWGSCHPWPGILAARPVSVRWAYLPSRPGLSGFLTTIAWKWVVAEAREQSELLTLLINHQAWAAASILLCKDFSVTCLHSRIELLLKFSNFQFRFFFLKKFFKNPKKGPSWQYSLFHGLSCITFDTLKESGFCNLSVGAHPVSLKFACLVLWPPSLDDF